MSAPVVWSVSGLDPGGGAGLSADQRAADAAGVHLCPVAAALTAQDSLRVAAVMPVPAAQLHAQLEALLDDLPPAAIKTGLLGSVENVRVVASMVDRLRQRRPAHLVVDPVLRASTGAVLADDALVEAYRAWLLPRATVVTPNRAEARRIAHVEERVPALARALRAAGARASCITGGDADDALALDWLDAADATGWLAAPRRAGADNHGTGCAFATGLAAALARGFDLRDAAVLAKMLTASALRADTAGSPFAPGQGAGPVRPRADFIDDASLMPWVVDGEAPPDHVPAMAGAAPRVTGLYAIADSGPQAAALVAAGVRTVQLRMKADDPRAGPPAELADSLARHLPVAQAAARRAGGLLVLNDHWAAARAHGVEALHLGQEDLAMLDDGARAWLARARRGGLRLGISSHTPWELARARGWAPDYIACGPVWPTPTKAMPWQPQGLDNLGWWVRMAGAPVVAIGGITSLDRLAQVADAGAAAGAVARALAGASAGEVGAWRLAWEAAERAREARRGGARVASGWPHPCRA